MSKEAAFNRKCSSNSMVDEAEKIDEGEEEEQLNFIVNKPLLRNPNGRIF